MSSVPQTGVALERIKHYLTVLIIALLVPLIVSFVLWMIGSAFGTPAGITYGIGYIPGNASGIGYLWISGSGSSPALPVVMIRIFNDLLIFLSMVVAIFAIIELISALGAYVASSRY
ncbi:MAG: hypothetical protein ACP5GH_06690 [Nitrososphaeria archaeon]